jgi:hypothetical protein
MIARRFALLLLLLIACWTLSVRAADDPLNGTWKLNISKSKFDPGPPPKSLVNKYEPDGKGAVKVTTDQTDAQGKTTHREYTERYDGKEYDAQSQGGDKVRLTRVDSHTVDGTYKRDGKDRANFRRVVSKDGKTLTVDAHGESPTVKGQQYHDVRVFDRQ